MRLGLLTFIAVDGTKDWSGVFAAWIIGYRENEWALVKVAQDGPNFGLIGRVKWSQVCA